MSSQEVFRVQFLVDSNINKITGEIQAAQVAAARLEQQFQTLGSKGIATAMTAFSDSLRASGQFQVSQVDSVHATQKFGAALEKQKLSLLESTRALKGWRQESGLMRRAARENVRMMQSFALTAGPMDNGRQFTSVATRMEEDLSRLGARTLYAQERFKVFNSTLKNASTSIVNYGKNTQWAGRQMMVGMTIPIAALGAVSAMTFKKIDEELVRITKVYGDTLGGGNVDVEAVRRNATALATDIASSFGVAMEETLALTADVAAVGFTGKKLEAAVRETTRLALLGEVDRQQAMKTTLSLQTAFSLSTKEMTNAINFLNAAENATSTSLQDMTEAIPRAGTVVKALGGDVEDLTLYITAMREGGISAAEGANAIKSGLASIITPTKEASNYVKTLGIDLEAIVQQGKGDLTKTLLLFQESLQNLDKLDQQKVISKLFGKFQMGRMTALFENLNKEGSQTQTIFKLMGYSAEEMAQTAETELNRVAESISGKFNRAWQTLRANLAVFGEEFLKIGTAIMNMANGALKWFNDLSDGAKKFTMWALILAAATGPLVMVQGILANWVGHMVTFGRLMLGAGAWFGGKRGLYKQYTPQDAAEKLGVTLETGAYKATAAMDALNASVGALVARLETLYTQAINNQFGIARSMGGGLQWDALRSNPLQSLGLTSETKSFNKRVRNSDTRGKMADFLAGRIGVEGQQAVIQKMAQEAVMYDYTKNGLTPEQRSALQARAQTISDDISKIADPAERDAAMTRLNDEIEKSFPGITDKYREHVARITADVDDALRDQDKASRRARLMDIFETEGLYKGAQNSLATQGLRTGGRGPTGTWLSLALNGAEARALDYIENKNDPNQSHYGAPLAIDMLDELQSAHTAPDTLALGISETMLAQDEAELQRRREMQAQMQQTLDERLAAQQRLVDFDNEQLKKNQTMDDAQRKQERDRFIAGDEVLAREVGTSDRIDQFNQGIDDLHAQNEALKQENNRHAEINEELHRKTERATEEAVRATEREADQRLYNAQQQAKAARKARITQAIGGAGAIFSALPMMTGFMGSAGDAIAPAAMGASVGMMSGSPWGALIGAAAGGGLQLFNSLKAQSADASNALKMSTISAEIFGNKLRSIADANIDDFLKSMTDNAEAADKAAAAMYKFIDALRNAPEGSPEKATLDRLKDLGGGNSWWEQFGNDLLELIPLVGAYFNMGIDRFANNGGGSGTGEDVAPGAQAKALLKQRYASALMGGSSPEEALGEVSAYAKEAGLTYTLKSINDELKAISSNSAALTVMSNNIKTLAVDGKDVKEVFRDVFNPDVISQMSTRDLPTLTRALKNANMSYDDYIISMEGGDQSQAQFAEEVRKVSKELRVDLQSAIAIVIARLNELPVNAADFVGKSQAEVMAILDAIQTQDDLTKGVQKKLDAYNKKQSAKSDNNVEKQRQDSADAIDAAREASEKEIEAMEDAAEKRQKAMEDEIEAVKKRYDDEIEAIQKANQAKQDAFDDEQERIQRAKDARAAEIDYLRAMSEGRYYDAAAIKNDMEATYQQNQIEDAQNARNDKAEKKIEGLAEERDAKLETLNDQLEKQREHDQKMLENKREQDQKMLDQMQKTEDARLDAVEKTNKKIDKSNNKTAVTMEELVQQIMKAAKRGEGELNKVLKKYNISQDQAMALLVDKAGLSATDAARVIGKNLSAADWTSLAKGIEAKLDNDKNAGKYFEAFWQSMDKAPNGPATPTYPGTKKPALKAYGGYISGPGTARSDSIPARLSNGEYVINARSVAKVGVGNLNKINQQGKLPGFAEGGLVPDGRGIAQSVTRVTMWDYIHSLIDKRVKQAKDAAESGGTVDSKGFTLDGVPTGEWGKPVPLSWNTYPGHGFARDYQPSPVRMGQPVYSVGPGKVAGMNDGVSDNGDHSAGSPSNWVLVWHRKNGKKYSTYYQHLKQNSVKVRPGDIVTHETMLGRIGTSGHSTGPHLHFEVREGWNDRYTGPWSAEIQSIWNLLTGGYIGNEGNPTPDGSPMTGIVSGYTNTMLKEYVDIYSKLGMSKKKATEKAQSDANSIASMGDSKSPEAARAFAKSILGRYGWSGIDQWKALLSLWNRESGWKWYADNPSSDAYGIPQSLPGSKMRSAGADWKTNPETQIKWGLGYIRDRYGSPLKAWDHSQRVGWYANGGMVIPALRKGATINYDNTLANLHRGESVLTAPLTNKLKEGVGVASGGDVIYNVDITVKENMSAREAENLVFNALDRHSAKVGRR